MKVRDHLPKPDADRVAAFSTGPDACGQGASAPEQSGVDCRRGKARFRARGLERPAPSHAPQRSARLRRVPRENEAG